MKMYSSCNKIGFFATYLAMKYTADVERKTIASVKYCHEYYHGPNNSIVYIKISKRVNYFVKRATN